MEKSDGRLCEDPIPSGPDLRPVSRSKWWDCVLGVSHQALSASRHREGDGRWWPSRADVFCAGVPVLLPLQSLRTVVASTPEGPGYGLSEGADISTPALRAWFFLILTPGAEIGS